METDKTNVAAADGDELVIPMPSPARRDTLDDEPASPPKDESTKDDAPKRQRHKPVRLLVGREVAGVRMEPNHVAILPTKIANELKKAGEADDEDAAVEYALALNDGKPHHDFRQSGNDD